jgi:hypothetical protein
MKFQKLNFWGKIQKLPASYQSNITKTLELESKIRQNVSLQAKITEIIIFCTSPMFKKNTLNNTDTATVYMPKCTKPASEWRRLNRIQ